MGCRYLTEIAERTRQWRELIKKHVVEPNKGGRPRISGEHYPGPPRRELFAQEMIQRLEMYGETQTFDAGLTLFKEGLEVAICLSSSGAG